MCQAKRKGGACRSGWGVPGTASGPWRPGIIEASTTTAPHEEDFMNIAKIMIPKACTVVLHQDNTVRQGLETMCHNSYTAIPVLDGQGGYVGCVTEGDFLRHILAVNSTDKKKLEQTKIRDIMRSDFCPAVSIRATFQEVMALAMEQNFVPVVDDRNALCGIVTRRNLLGAVGKNVVEPKPELQRV